jgi:hypothetical protein
MASELRKRGFDPNQFKPKIPERPMPTGRYPRKAGDLVLENSNPDWSPWTSPGAPSRR